MTQQRKDNHSTEFGLWLRNQMWGEWVNNEKYPIISTKNQKTGNIETKRVWRDPDTIDSSYKNGFLAYNIDYVWRSYKTNEWMLIEEKRKGSKVSDNQKSTFDIVDKACRSDRNYRGFHTLVFLNTFPEDGGIELDGKRITKEQLVKFIRFEDYK